MGGAKEQGTGTWVTHEWQANTWHHAAFTWDQAACKVYIDGKLRESTPVGAPLTQVDAPNIELGGCDGAGNLDAALCELHILDRALSPQEIADAAGCGTAAAASTTPVGPLN